MKPLVLIVLDTNVLVSGLLNREGSPGQILDLILDGTLQVAVDERLLDEYTRVLHRSHLNISEGEAQSILLFLAVSSLRVTAHPLKSAPAQWPDPKDIPFAEVAVTAGARALVTGNQKHFAHFISDNIEVLSPREFLDRISRPPGSEGQG